MPDAKRSRHLIATEYGKARKYLAPSGGPQEKPRRIRQRHGNKIRGDLAKAVENAYVEAGQLIGVEKTPPGIYLTFESASGYLLPLDNLESAGKGIEIANVTVIDGVMRATVFVPNGAEEFFRKKINEYLTKETRTNKPRHAPLVDAVESIALSQLTYLWTDDPNRFPVDDTEIWWEIWLRSDSAQEFQAALNVVGVVRSSGELHFPGRTVIAARARPSQLNILRYSTGAIAELRRLPETPSFFLNLKAYEQAEWGADLVGRLTPPDDDAPAVTVLDTGVSRAHPLIAPILSDADWHTYDPAWSRGDNAGHQAHGTAMAGIAGYGDLQGLLEEAEPISATHRLESVRILPPHGANPRELYGPITISAVAQAEFNAPDRLRVFCMAVTAEETNGRPSSWSASVDELTFGTLDGVKRLFVISAGNVNNSTNLCDSYLQRSAESPIESPAQSWNSLVVGACTHKHAINDRTYAGWRPLASPGELSPFSRTSCSWEFRWPTRPDVVFEGGNLAVDPLGTQWADIDDYGVLTTHANVAAHTFDIIHATSAASARASNFAAQLFAHEPSLWPEAVKGLIVHSASWSREMHAKFLAASKRERGRLLRIYGYGEPDLERAKGSTSNEVTVVAMDEIKVVKEKKIPELRFYDLPWPKDILDELGDAEIKLRVTLSYFVDPNPGNRGWKGRYRYSSYGLRFHLKKSLENEAEFLARVNLADRDDDYAAPIVEDDNWFLGAQQRDRGALHSDIWVGTASELAARDKLVVAPIGGWWKSALNEADARYALIISISCENDVDLYSAIFAELKALATVRTSVETAIEV
ncbi:MAG: S8 family peptidase [Ferrovibrio sp.]|uniref:S8 family peptidase n=1 Tax=Ferrovibrio sp. TaxID=1917215 RepID=UPI003919A539